MWNHKQFAFMQQSRGTDTSVGNAASRLSDRRLFYVLFKDVISSGYIVSDTRMFSEWFEMM
jgi:hypothetical protein